MGLNTVLLIAAAILPAAVLCRYVYKKDVVEKEPIEMLVKLLVVGVFSCFPAAAAEELIGGIIDGVFMLIYPSNLTTGGYYAYIAVTYFLGVALIEEGFKWLFLVKLTKKNREFNSLFDGIVYAVFISLGFAAFENILYVVEYGWINALERGVLSVPGHMFNAVMMGYYYSRWKIFERAAEAEGHFIRLGFVEGGKKALFTYKKEKWLSIIVPIFFHGTYDFCCVADALWATALFYGFVIFMYIYCFSKIKETARKDALTVDCVTGLIIEKYPEVSEVIVANELTEV